MFVTILFGDSRMEMVNLNCKLINFIHHLKERSGLDFKECVDLMDSSGRVMNLEGKQRSLALTSSVLGERQIYVLLRVCRDDTGGQKYISLLNNCSQSHPELSGNKTISRGEELTSQQTSSGSLRPPAELLKKLSNPDRERDRRLRGGRTQRRNPVKQTRSRNISANDKKHR